MSYILRKEYHNGKVVSTTYLSERALMLAFRQAKRPGRKLRAHTLTATTPDKTTEFRGAAECATKQGVRDE